MKFCGVLLLIGLCAFRVNMALAARYNKPAIVPTATPRITVAQELNEIRRMIPTKAIQHLVIRYLLNDEQFQAFVRIINSQDGYFAYMRFNSQPEVMGFKSWVRSQIMLSGDDLDSGESNESLKVFNPSPYWSQSVMGWQGFVNEFYYYYPEEAIRMQIQTKAAQNGIFAELIQRLKSLKSAYDRVTAMPETQRLLSALEAKGIETAAIDGFIRNQFGWQETANNVVTGGGLE